MTKYTRRDVIALAASAAMAAAMLWRTMSSSHATAGAVVTMKHPRPSRYSATA